MLTIYRDISMENSKIVYIFFIKCKNFEKNIYFIVFVNFNYIKKINKDY